MPASPPVTAAVAAAPAAQASAPSGAGAARAASGAAGPAFMDRLANALGQAAGPPQDAQQGTPLLAPAPPQSGVAAGAADAAPPAGTPAALMLPAIPPPAPQPNTARVGGPATNASGPGTADTPVRTARKAGSPAGQTGPAAPPGGPIEAAPSVAPGATPPAAPAPPALPAMQATDAPRPRGSPPSGLAATEAAPPHDVLPAGSSPAPSGRTAHPDAPATAPGTDASFVAVARPPAAPSNVAGPLSEISPADLAARAVAGAAPPPSAQVGHAAPGVASSPGTAEPAGSASPAQQIAAPLVALASGTDRSQRLTVRLDPEALGAVQIYIERPKDGPARVEITVERAQTLSLILRDQPQLQRALDQAGIPPDGRTLQFEIAAPNPSAPGDTPFLDHRPNGGSQPQAGDGAGTDGDAGGSGRGPREGADEDEPAFRSMPATAYRLLRAGLDITA